MSKIYIKANDKFVATNILYVDDSTKHLFTDEAKKEKVTKDELLELFYKGVTVKYEDIYYKPLLFKVDSGAGALVVSDGTTEHTFYSQEHA